MQIGGELEPASIERVEPVEDGIVAGSLVIFGADLANGALIGAGKDNDRPDVARIEGQPSIPGKLKSGRWIVRTQLISKPISAV